MERGYKHLSIIVLGLLLATGLFAQTGQTMYYMNLPQRSELNPAFRPGNRVYVQLPLISGINVAAGNNFFNFSDVFIKNPNNDSLMTVFHPDADIEGFISEIKNTNYLETQAKVQLLGLGFAFGKKNYITLDINTKVSGYAALPGDLLRLAIEGNQQFVGSTIDFSSFGVGLNAYNEIGVGYSRDITEKLRVGVKGKLLLGIASASTKVNSLGISVSDDYAHSLDADLILRVSGPVEFAVGQDNQIDSVSMTDIPSSEIISYILKTGNTGLGIDIGAEYSITDRLHVSASVTDLGYIKWRRGTTNIEMNGEFSFSGFEISDVISGDLTIDSLGGMILDSLQQSMNMSPYEDVYTTYMPFNLNLGGSFELTNFFSVGALSTTRFVGKQVKEALTLSANLNYRNLVSTTLSYTMANSSYRNLGMGVAFRFGYGQLYLVADHIPFSFNEILIDGESDETTRLLLPADWNMFNLRMGLNLTFGNKPRE